MHHTSALPVLATPVSSETEPKALSVLHLEELKALFEQLPDPRAGRPNHHYPLAAMLLSALVALLKLHHFRGVSKGE